MKRRALWELITLTTAVAVLALALLVGGAAGGNGNGHRGQHGSIANGQAGYHFLVFDAVAGTTDRMIITGDGPFNGNRAHGGGTFDHFSAVGSPPLPVVASGTWRANDVVSFTHSATNHGGVFEGGVLVMHATFYPKGAAAIRNVTMEVDCNLGPIGFSTGKPEGVVITFPGGPVFAPTNLGPEQPTTGVTVFTVGHGEGGD
ncbi:MAG TPA: hypothetical protein VGH82_04695 [Gaiellaceae bacterium]|jgi:hypothetical protein